MNIRILIINDDPTVRELWRRLVHAHTPNGVSVSTQSIEKLTPHQSLTFRPDLVLMDPGSVGGGPLKLTTESMALGKLHDFYPGAEWMICYSVTAEQAAPFLNECEGLHSRRQIIPVRWCDSSKRKPNDLNLTTALKAWFEDFIVLVD